VVLSQLYKVARLRIVYISGMLHSACRSMTAAYYLTSHFLNSRLSTFNSQLNRYSASPREPRRGGYTPKSPGSFKRHVMQRLPKHGCRIGITRLRLVNPEGEVTNQKPRSLQRHVMQHLSKHGCRVGITRLRLVNPEGEVTNQKAPLLRRAVLFSYPSA
jgi:hypothetical protein